MVWETSQTAPGSGAQVCAAHIVDFEVIASPRSDKFVDDMDTSLIQ